MNLPKNNASPNVFKPYKARNVIAWSYWIGVGQNAENDYRNANNQAKELASELLAFAETYGALAQLALTGFHIFQLQLLEITLFLN